MVWDESAWVRNDLIPERLKQYNKMWVRNGMTLGTKWYDLGTKWYGLGYEMVWDESAWVRNDLIPLPNMELTP